MYIDQSAAELRLNVVGGPLDWSGFTVLRRDALTGSAWRIGAAIVGASHVLAVQHGRDTLLHEVFACRDPGPALDPRSRHYSGGARAVACKPADGMRYRFRPEVADLASGAGLLRSLEDRVRDARRTRGEIGLSFAFPSAPGATDPGRQPKTVVWVRVGSEDAVHVEAAHCYPNEETIVFSWSRIRVDR